MDQLQRLLLEQYSQGDRGISAAPSVFPKMAYTTSFVLTDPKSCSAAQKKGLKKCINCNEEVLYIDTKSRVHVLDCEEFAAQMKGSTAAFGEGICDYLLYNENENMKRPQIVFCELTCMAQKYVDANLGLYPAGKRVKAYTQIKKTIENLLNGLLLTTTIFSYPSKIGLFGWREEDKNDAADEAVENMEMFATTPSTESPLLYNTSLILGHNFTFMQIKYPAHFEWEKEYNNL